MENIRHFGIVVKNIEKSLGFYRYLLGFEVKKDIVEEGEFINAVLGLKNVRVRTVKMSAENGSALLELLCYESHLSGKTEKKEIFTLGPSHLALTVSNLDEEYRKLKKNYIKFISSPNISPDGRAKVAFCYDPENNPIELVEEIN